MSDPTAGDLALRLLSDIAVGGLTGLGTFYALFRNAKKQIEEQIKMVERQFAHRVDDDLVRAVQRSTEFEQRLYARMATVENRLDKQDDKWGDAVHDLERMDAQQDTQIAVVINGMNNMQAMIGRLETLMGSVAQTNQAQYREILDRLKQG